MWYYLFPIVLVVLAVYPIVDISPINRDELKHDVKETCNLEMRIEKIENNETNQKGLHSYHQFYK